MNSRYARPATTASHSYKHQLLLSTAYKPKKREGAKDDLLFKELAIEILPGEH